MSTEKDTDIIEELIIQENTDITICKSCQYFDYYNCVPHCTNKTRTEDNCLKLHK